MCKNLFEKSMENHFWRFGVLLPAAPLVLLKAGAQCAPHRDQVKRFGSQVTRLQCLELLISMQT